MERKEKQQVEMGRILKWEGAAESANIVDWLLSLFIRILACAENNKPLEIFFKNLFVCTAMTYTRPHKRCVELAILTFELLISRQVNDLQVTRAVFELILSVSFWG